MDQICMTWCLGIERKYCPFLLSCDHALYIQLIWLSKKKGKNRTHDLKEEKEKIAPILHQSWRPNLWIFWHTWNLAIAQEERTESSCAWRISMNIFWTTLKDLMEHQTGVHIVWKGNEYQSHGSTLIPSNATRKSVWVSDMQVTFPNLCFWTLI